VRYVRCWSTAASQYQPQRFAEIMPSALRNAAYFCCVQLFGFNWTRASNSNTYQTSCEERDTCNARRVSFKQLLYNVYWGRHGTELTCWQSSRHFSASNISWGGVTSHANIYTFMYEQVAKSATHASLYQQKSRHSLRDIKMQGAFRSNNCYTTFTGGATAQN
jgi:hypothetical protein